MLWMIYIINATDLFLRTTNHAFMRIREARKRKALLIGLHLVTVSNSGGATIIVKKHSKSVRIDYRLKSLYWKRP